MTQQPAAPALSVGTLFYLFGERCLPAAGRLGGHELPSGGKVNALDLATLVWAASIWNLRQTGALTLEPVTKKALGLVKTRHVQLAMGPTVVQKSGYEDAVMRGVGGGSPIAHDVVYAWFGSDTRDPEGHTLAVAKQEMVQFGLAHQVDAGRGAIGGLFLGRTRVQADPAAIAPWWEHFGRVQAAWVAFTQAEAELATTLLDNCRKAIRNRQESVDDDDF